MKRSNRLIILIGIILAVVAFGAIILLGGGSSTPPSGGGNNQQPTTVKVVVATADIPVGTVVTDAMVTLKDEAVATVPSDALKNTKDAVGLPMRQDVFSGDVITQADFASGGQLNNADLLRRLQPGFRAMAIQVDQVTGVGNLVQPGDHVDIVLSMEGTDNKFPIAVQGAPTLEGNPPTRVQHFNAVGNDILNHTSIKVLVQNVEVIGTLLPVQQATNNQQQNAQASPAPNSGNTGLVAGQQQIAILALTPQQVELVRFAQLDGNLSIVLRATADASAPPDATTGITLRQLVDKYGVLPPKIVLTTQP